MRFGGWGVGVVGWGFGVEVVGVAFFFCFCWVGFGMGFSLGKVLCGNFLGILDLRNCLEGLGGTESLLFFLVGMYHKKSNF